MLERPGPRHGRTRARLHHDERGQMGVAFVLSLVVLVMLFALALDAGLWAFDHRRAQTQADAAALGGVDLLPADDTTANRDAVATAVVQWLGYNGSGAADLECLEIADTALPPQLALGPTVPIVVKFRSTASDAERDDVVRPSPGLAVRDLRRIDSRVVHVPAVAKEAVLAALSRERAVERTSVAERQSIAGSPDDLSDGQSWALSKIGWDRAYASVVDGASRVAILDTGIDAQHPDLAPRIGPGWSAFGTDPNADPNGHGTAMAGIVSSVASGTATLSSVQVLGADGTGWDSDVAAGVLWAADNGADVILMGFSSPTYSATLAEALAYAWDRGAVLVAATGNGGSTAATYPAGMPHVIGVAATDANDELAAGSSTGSAAVTAPGVGIYTTAAGGSYGTVSGSSAASAYVAGLAALLNANGGSNAEARNQMVGASDPVAGEPFGRINVFRALGPTVPEQRSATVHATPSSGETARYVAALNLQSVAVGPQLPSPVAAGSSASYTVTVRTTGPGSLNVALSASGLPAGASASFSPSTLNFLSAGTLTSTLTVTTTCATPAGPSGFTVTGTEVPGGTTRSDNTPTLTVDRSACPTNTPTATIPATATPTATSAAGVITVANPSPASVSVTAGAAATYTITVTFNDNGNRDATLKITGGLPAGAFATFSPNPLHFTGGPGSGTATLTIATNCTTPAGSFNFTIRAENQANPTEFGTNTGTLIVAANACPPTPTPFPQINSVRVCVRRESPILFSAMANLTKVLVSAVAKARVAEVPSEYALVTLNDDPGCPPQSSLWVHGGAEVTIAPGPSGQTGGTYTRSPCDGAASVEGSSSLTDGFNDVRGTFNCPATCVVPPPTANEGVDWIPDPYIGYVQPTIANLQALTGLSYACKVPAEISAAEWWPGRYCDRPGINKDTKLHPGVYYFERGIRFVAQSWFSSDLDDPTSSSTRPSDCSEDANDNGVLNGGEDLCAGGTAGALDDEDVLLYFTCPVSPCNGAGIDSVDMSGGSTLELRGDADHYRMLIWVDRTAAAGCNVHLGGNSETFLGGRIYAAPCTVELAGAPGSNLTLNVSVVADQIQFTGAATFALPYDSLTAPTQRVVALVE